MEYTCFLCKKPDCSKCPSDVKTTSTEMETTEGMTCLDCGHKQVMPIGSLKCPKCHKYGLVGDSFAEHLAPKKGIR